MTRRLAAICFVAMVTLGVTSRSVSAQVDLGRETLKGINTVFVLVEDLPSGASRLGLSPETIQTDVELKLRLAGLRVVTQGVNLPGAPYVYVRLTVTDPPEAASIEVSLNQNARLERNGEFAAGVKTWGKIAVTANPTGQGIRDTVKDGVDMFLNAWLSVNPKQ